MSASLTDNAAALLKQKNDPEFMKALNRMDEAANIFKDASEDIEELKRVTQANQPVIDQAVIMMKENKNGNFASKKDFGEAFAEAIESKASELKSLESDRKGFIKMQLKAVATMTTSGHLTGDGVISYSGRQALLPAQKVNFRDLIPTTYTENQTYAHYRETGGEGDVAEQTEGSAKANLDFDLSEVKTVTNYLAGTVTFSKQLLKNLPWMQTALPRQLMRKFYAAENAKFWAAVAANATGSASTSETDDNKALIDFIMDHLDSDFNASFILVKNQQKGRLLKLLYDNSGYLGAGAVVGTPDGSISIAGIPVIGASFATDDKVMIIDRDYIERVEAEALNIQFSYEHNDNFTKNLVTARIECMEELNLLLTQAHIYADFGNAS